MALEAWAEASLAAHVPLQQRLSQGLVQMQNQRLCDFSLPMCIL